MRLFCALRDPHPHEEKDKTTHNDKKTMKFYPSVINVGKNMTNFKKYTVLYNESLNKVEK